MYCSKCGNLVEDGSKFCSKCGNPLEFTNNLNNSKEYNNVEYTQVRNEKKNQNSNVPLMVALGAVIGCLVIVAVYIVSLLVGSNKYYFNDNTYGEEVITSSKEDNTSVISNTDTSNKKKGKYSTSVVSDNVYSNQNIKNEKDAKELIVKDSVDQKEKEYPKEVKAVEDDIISSLGITAANLKEMDSGYAKKLEEVFEKVYASYPLAKGYITNLALVNTGINDQYIAAFMPIFKFATGTEKSGYPWVIKTQVLLNSVYFLNPDRLELALKDSVANGHFPDNADLYSPVAHELGHYLSFLAMMNHYDVDSILLINNDTTEKYYNLRKDFANGDFSLTMLKEAYQNYVNDTSDSISFDDWRGTISGYALAKDNSGDYIYDETIAESFHDVYLNGDNAATASKYVTTVLKKYLEE